MTAPDNSNKQDDYAKLHFAYYEDTDLVIVADQLEDEHGAAGAHLVWLYWPRMIAAAKAARTFGWFATTPRKLARSVGDALVASDWQPRARMWELLAGRDLIRLRQGVVEAPIGKIDVLLVEYEKWQSLSNREHSKLKRERAKHDAGEAVHWTVRHWSEFAFTPLGADTDSLSPTQILGRSESIAAATDCNPRHKNSVTDTDSRSERHKNSVTDREIVSVTEHETRQDETKSPTSRVGVREGGPLTEQVAPPTNERWHLDQAIAIFVDCSQGGIDDSAWRSQLEQHRSRHLGAPIERYVDAAMQMRAKYLDSKRPFTMNAGWSWFTKAWASLAADEHRAKVTPILARRGDSLTPHTPEWIAAGVASLGPVPGSGAS